jgi:hypothetical protein
MPTPYSEDLRLPVVMAFESGKTTREVGVHYQWPRPCLESASTLEKHRQRSEQANRWLSGVPCWNLMKPSSGNS